MVDAPKTIGLIASPYGLGWRLWNRECDTTEEGAVRYVLEADYAALEAQLAVVRKALEEISEPETVWRRRAAEDGIRLAATDIAALTRERTPEVIARTALRKLGGRNVD